MNWAQVHLMMVHIPVICCLFSLVLFLLAWKRKDDFLWKFGCITILASAVCAGIAYWSGPLAWEMIDGKYDVHQADMEQHGVIARAALIGVVVLAVLCINLLNSYYQEETPSRWLQGVLIAGTVAICWMFAWSAHLGGLIRHPELRHPALRVFPELSVRDRNSVEREPEISINPDLAPAGSSLWN